jgi:hypothetical protein
VEDYAQTSARTYSFWGTDGKGNDFCCYVADSSHEISKLILVGTDDPDDLSFSYSTRNVTHADTDMDGYGDVDNLLGSDDAACVDDISGQQADDVIDAQDGADIVSGGAGADTITAGDGDDTVNAGIGNDVIEGGNGNDTIDGGDDDDILQGEAGNDTLYGGKGADVVCGGGTTGSGHDYLHAMAPLTLETPNAVDWLWEPSSSNAPTGGGSVAGDECGHSTHGSGWAGAPCDYSNSTRPAACYQ